MMRTALRNSLLVAALVHSVHGDACATRHWNEGENAFWACMGQWGCPVHVQACPTGIV